MHSIDAVTIDLLRRSAKERRERLARQMEQVEEQRRALWLRMDALRDHDGRAERPIDGAVWPANVTREAAASALEDARRVPAAVG